MACMDFLIWIGGKNTLYKTIEDYLKEAEQKGCSRKIRHLPPGAIPGISRVFLVHKGGRKAIGKASLFGFFVLRRIEIMTAYKGRVRLQPKFDRVLWSDEIFSKVRKRTEHCEKSPDKQHCVQSELDDLKDDIDGAMREGKFQYRRKRPDSDGNSFLEYVLDEFERYVKDVLKDYIKDKIKDYLRDNAPDSPINKYLYALVETVDRLENPLGFKRISLKQAGLAGGLGCSKRKSKGAVYLVDELSCEITDRFQKRLYDWLEHEGLHEGLREYPGYSRRQLIAELKKTERPKEEVYPEEGVILFREAHDEVLKEWQPKAKIPDVLKGKVNVRGDIVVFNKPYPIFKRCPKAQFRGYIRIDGGKLIEEIGKGRRTPVIPYCVAAEPEKAISQSQLEACLASTLWLNKKTASNLLKEQQRPMLEELSKQGYFRLPGYGRFEVRHRKAGEVLVFRPTKEVKEFIQCIK